MCRLCCKTPLIFIFNIFSYGSVLPNCLAKNTGTVILRSVAAKDWAVQRHSAATNAILPKQLL
jgi:hypothetical protein